MFAIPVFSISIQINPDFAKFFKPADLAQIEVLKIDPAVLKKHDEIAELTDFDVFGDDNEIKIADDVLAEIFVDEN